MCLIKKIPGFDIAEDDIRVYKVLNKHYFLDGVYTSPYRGTKYEMNRTYSSLLNEVMDVFPYCEFHVEEGLHAFVDKESAIECVKRGLVSWIVCEAIIPKGSRYAKGMDDDIVSDKLIVIREVY